MFIERLMSLYLFVTNYSNMKKSSSLFIVQYYILIDTFIQLQITSADFAVVTSLSCNIVIFKLSTSCPLFVHVFPTYTECNRSCVSEALVALHYVDMSILL
ncbi:hypothetical protein PanWU01x14_047910 [Parasponia andersonii]|uniref:Uncharacterized protein n=1 Tax=Parasponia andersonii TaxID=3476 RepID=A0A2P5DN70_PARAD|nr:hypothetical protein PanWU01x14_047910 [Parasponia andersonii]